MVKPWPDVNIEIHEGNYIATSGQFSFVVNELFPISGEDYNKWAYSLDNLEIEGAIQMYYDLWNFGSGNRFYKDMVDCLTTEKARRRRK